MANNPIKTLTCIDCGEIRTVEVNGREQTPKRCKTCNARHVARTNPRKRLIVDGIDYSNRRIGDKVIRHPLKRAWARMHERCKPTYRDACYYAERGVFVCKEWSTPEPFIRWALQNGWEQGDCIDRIDTTGPYSPSNVQFLDRATHAVKTNADRKAAA